MSVGGTVVSGPLVLAVPVALAAGLVSFASPCVLPLVPGYLSYVTGLSGEEIAERRQGRVLLGTLLFVLGFSVVFVVEGALVGAAASVFLREHQDALQRGLGALTVVFGLAFAGALPGVSREWRLHTRPRLGLAGAPLLGALFGLGWTPCLGPTIGAVLTLAARDGSAARGAGLAAAYCVGLGLPFLVAGLAYRRALGTFKVIRAHSAWVMRLGGAMLVTVGLLLVTGTWGELIVELQRHYGTYSTGL
ncbi:cytochrome c-type biogenesis protein [Motilibacter peucedani]|uniref:Cytochrome c-type biogenesis protein n=1 Tax=Motilibacter peucedani TaxID=598650 RepID=A0A420XLD3_9ACTN|nr:cytochrome c biogenesis protein CcdA [Motilibacter peucedani]RKS69167.1 cytochrome c-type biogenesis protein [Motilibacter peucedani]